MQLLLQTNDPVLLSFVQSLLADAGIEAMIFDDNISLIEGSIGVFPRRVMVQEDDLSRARDTITQAGLAGELAQDEGP